MRNEPARLASPRMSVRESKHRSCSSACSTDSGRGRHAAVQRRSLARSCRLGPWPARRPQRQVPSKGRRDTYPMARGVGDDVGRAQVVVQQVDGLGGGRLSPALAAFYEIVKQLNAPGPLEDLPTPNGSVSWGFLFSRIQAVRRHRCLQLLGLESRKSRLCSCVSHMEPVCTTHNLATNLTAPPAKAYLSVDRPHPDH